MGMPGGKVSSTSTQLPPSVLLYENLRQPSHAELSGTLRSVMSFVVLRCRPEKDE